MIIAKGTLTERPFARTLLAISAKGFSGQLAITSEGKQYVLLWHDGKVVGAQSAGPADRIGRIALNMGLVDSTQLGAILRGGKKDERSQFDELVKVAGLSAAQAIELKNRGLLARATRGFALKNGTFELDSDASFTDALVDGETPPLMVESLILHGVLFHFDLGRLRSGGGFLIGKKLSLVPEAEARLKLAGVSASSSKVLKALLKNDQNSLDTLIGTPGVSEQDAWAYCYALAASNLLGAAVDAPPAAEKTVEHAPLAGEAEEAEEEKTVEHAPLADEAEEETAERPMLADDAALSEQKTAERSKPSETAKDPPREEPPKPAHPRTISRAKKVAQTPTVRLPAQALSDKAIEIRDLIFEKAKKAEGKNHFEILGLTETATVAEVQKSYFKLAKKLHPDRLQSLGLEAIAATAQTVFAEINLAFAELGDEKKADIYRKKLQTAVLDTGDVAEMAAKILEAEEHFKMGEIALRTNQFSEAKRRFGQAAELQPEDAIHQAFYAWSIWCDASDKEAVRDLVEETLTLSFSLAKNCVPAWFYKGVVAKQTDDVVTAKSCFKKVLELSPSQATSQNPLQRQASIELRLLENRTSDAKKTGLFRRR